MATRLSTSRRGPRTSQSDGSRRFEPPTHLGHALASEWTKIRSVRSTGWCLAMMFTGIVVIGVLNVFVAKDTVRQGEDTLGLGISGFLIGQIPVITLGVLAVTSEYGTGMIRTTLTVSPRRTRMLTAKALVLSALVLS
ncbi:MAG: hypothetical protein ACRDTD_27800, partial [Pseudonocardiaceae bacterium]